MTSDLQFGFKSGFSTTLCTGVMKAVINCYLNNGSKVYGCLINASKAFDLPVDHCILIDKLERGMTKPVVRLLLHWYITLSNYAFVGWGDHQTISKFGPSRWSSESDSVYNLP